MDTRSYANENRNEPGEQNVGDEDGEACHGDESALAIAVVGLDAEQIAVVQRDQINQHKEEKEAHS